MTSLITNFVPSLTILGVIFIVALVLTQTRPAVSSGDLPAINRTVLIAAGVHVLHFTEETMFDFHILFPQLFGLPAMSLWAFIAFNCAWIAIWLLGAQLKQTHALVIATFWFLAIASAMNCIAHPLLALLTGGYFPGLITSPLAGVIGFILLNRLRLASSA